MTDLEILEGQMRRVDVNGLGPVASGIYLLIECDAIVYVGKSKNVHARVRRHASVGWSFDRAMWIALPVKVLPYYEGAFIRALAPRDNSNAPVDCGYDMEILDGFGIGHLFGERQPLIIPESPKAELPPVACGIRAARKRAGLTMDDLARILGVSRQAVHWWEHGESTPTVANLQRTALALGAEVSELLSGELVD